MTIFKTILVTTDFSETSKKAFPLARELAGRFGAKIILANCMEDRSTLLATDVSPTIFREVVETQKTRSQERLAMYGQELGDDVRLELVEGTPHMEIVRVAEEQGVDLIVMATHGRGFFSHAFLGSTTERVLRRAPCPVLVVRDAEGIGT